MQRVMMSFVSLGMMLGSLLAGAEGDTKAAARAIAEMTSDERWWYELSTAAAAQAREMFGSQRFVAAMRDILST